MSPKLISVLLVFLLSISITVCSSTVSANEQNPAIDAYKKVLQNKAAFTTEDKTRKFYLNEFLEDGPYGIHPEYPFKLIRFTVLDMDGDKIPEVVLALAMGNADHAQFYEVLHYYNGEVYGYIFSNRMLMDLKKDGTSIGLGGVATHYYQKLRFTSDACAFDTLGYCDWGKYFINNKPATEESFQYFVNEQEGKSDAVWYEFTQENIENQLLNK